MTAVPAGVVTAVAAGAPRESFVTVAGCRCRLWEKGEGAPLGFLPGLRGLPRWPAFLDALARTRRVVAMSPPGFHGSDPGHRDLDGLMDWVTMTLDLLEAAGVAGYDLVGASAGGMLAAEAAAASNASVRKLVLLGSFGLYDESAPPALFFANTPPQQDALLATEGAALQALVAPPEGASEAELLEWEIQSFRANEAAARLLWPMGDHGLVRRLHRVRARTLVVWGREDRIFAPSYARGFADRIAGPARHRVVEGAGHLCWIDRPDQVAAAVASFVGTPRVRRAARA